MIRRQILMLLAVAGLVSCASSSDYDTSASRALPRGHYSGNEIGPSPVGAIPDIALRDGERNKDLVITIEYPTRGGPHPAIVFSPAFGGTNRSYIGLSSYWASNGYVVVRVNHSDRGAVDAQTATDWQSRARDVTSVLGSFVSLEQRYPELQGKIDATKIAVAGHGYGAQTALLAAGDPRVKAVVAMVPDARNVAIAELMKPALFITSMPDVLHPDTEAYALAPSGDKWLISIEGAQAPAFTGRFDAFTEAQAREAARDDPMVDPMTGRQREVRASRVQSAMLRTQEMFGVVRGTALAFFDAYLKGDAEGRTALEKAGERRGVHVEHK